jgi:hypothetical protein
MAAVHGMLYTVPPCTRAVFDVVAMLTAFSKLISVCKTETVSVQCEHKVHTNFTYCYILGFLGNMTSAPCYISLVTQQWKLAFQCYMLHFLSNTTIEAETFRLLWRGGI